MPGPGGCSRQEQDIDKDALELTLSGGEADRKQQIHFWIVCEDYKTDDVGREWVLQGKPVFDVKSE